MTSSGADNPRDSLSSLTYRDPTGETAVRNLTGRTIQVTWEDGFQIYLNSEDLRPLLHRFNFRMSRKGHIWGQRKTPAATGVQNRNTNPQEGETINEDSNR